MINRPGQPALAIDVMVDRAAGVECEVSDPTLAQAARAAVHTAVESAARDELPRLTNRIEVSVRLTDNTEIQRLNARYRSIDRPTDVLSFAFTDESETTSPTVPPNVPQPLGEVVLSCQCAKQQAAELGHSLQTEASWLVIHGTLQLLGFHHETEEEAETMEELEQKALNLLGISG